MCDSSVVRLLLPVLKMTHGNKQNELSAQGDLAGKHNLFSFFFFPPNEIFLRIGSASLVLELQKLYYLILNLTALVDF